MLACFAVSLAPGAALAQCGPEGGVPCNPYDGLGLDCCRDVEYVASMDPNDKVGPLGFGPQRWVVGQPLMPYTIYFENIAAATAAAQEVRITDVLDPATLDLTTFAFLEASFGDTSVAAQPGTKTFALDVDRRPAENVIVRIEAALNVATGLLTCRFRSLDPLTLDPLDDPDGGFLPPNQVSPQGEGHITFVVRAKAGLATGTRIGNVAHIVFDVNDPIDTPEWFNHVDAEAPLSQVDPLPAVTMAANFIVSWGGTDAGSGIRDYTVFVSDDGGPWQPWRIGATAPADTFVGQHLHTYRFYSVARDSAGNVEAAASSEDALTLVDLTTAALPSLVDARSDGRHVRVLWHSAEAIGAAWVERRTVDTPWSEIGTPESMGRDLYEFRDSTVVSGKRYGYRLMVPRDGAAVAFGEVWIEVASVPVELSLAFANPAHAPLLMEFALPNASPAVLEMFDTSGRRMLARRLEGLGSGRHRYALGDGAWFPSGSYIVRLTQDGRAVTRKLMVIR